MGGAALPMGGAPGEQPAALIDAMAMLDRLVEKPDASGAS